MTDLGEELYGAAPAETPAFDLGADLYGAPSAEPDLSRQGFFGRINQDWLKRKEVGASAADAYATGQQSLPATYLDFGGMGVKAGGDVMKEGIKSGYDASPVPVQQFAQGVGGGLNDIADKTAVGKAVVEGGRQIGEAYQGFEKNYPNAARHIAAVGNIGSALLGVKPMATGLEAVGDTIGTVAPAVGRATSAVAAPIINHAAERAAKNTNSFVQNLTAPELIPTILDERAARSVKTGLLNRRRVELTPQEMSMHETISNLPIKEGGTMLDNYNIIEAENIKEAERIKNVLRANNIATDPNEVKLALENANANIEKDLSLAGGSLTPARKAFSRMKAALAGETFSADAKAVVKPIAGGDASVADLFQARKNFDEMSRRYEDGILDPKKRKAASDAAFVMRRTINDLIESKVPNLGYAKSMENQSNMYKALKNIKPKIKAEAATAIGRKISKAANLIPLHGALKKTLIGMGAVGGLGATAVAAPSLILPTAIAAGGAGTLYGTYKAGKALTNPFMERALGNTLDRTGRALQGKNPLVGSGFSAAAKAKQFPLSP